MSILINSYYRLLADVQKLSGVPLKVPLDTLTIQWVCKDGPALDKYLLTMLELIPSWGEDLSDRNLDEHKSIWTKANEILPDWLEPLWCEVLSERDPWKLKLLRQVLVFGYKAKFEPTNEQKIEASASFYNTDREVGCFDSTLEEEEMIKSPFWRTARSLVSRVIGDIDWNSIIPSHGPGAVFPSFDPCMRSDFTTLYDSIESHYPFFEYFYGLGVKPSYSEYKKDWENRLQCCSEIQSSLCCVPKDSRGPRLISVHPRESIWIQQGQRRLLESAILTRVGDEISLADQSVNGSAALRASVDRSFSTLDLSEASDRLSCKVVKFLFGEYAYNKISCSRASHIKMLDGSVVKLQKWAPMGNALCFPVESLVFWAMVRASISVRFGSRSAAATDVYVFGDDIIVETKYYSATVAGLERAGLKVNLSKSFHRGFFRESCGVDAFKGVNVTPHRMKRHVLSSYSDLDALCALAKNLRISGFEETASYIYRSVKAVYPRLSLTNERNTNGIIEYVDRDFGYLLKNEKTLKWSYHHHKWVVEALLPRARKARVARYWYNMQDSLVRLELAGDSSPVPSASDSGQGSGYPIPHRVSYKRGWTPIYLK